MDYKISLLIVEDNQDDADLLLIEIKKEGILPTSKIVASKAELKQALREEWDIILLDYTLKDFNGENALMLIREKNEDVPVIMISSTITEENAVKLLVSGAQDFILKGSLSRLVPAIIREVKEYNIRKDHRKAIEKLRFSEETANALLNANTDYALLMDTKGIILQANTALAKRYGMHPDKIKGKYYFDLLPEDTKNNRLKVFRKVLNKRKIHRYEENTGGFYHDTLIYPVCKNGNQIERVAVFERDITESKTSETELIKAKEKAEISDKIKTAFLANISHEVRTPLNVIIGLSELIKDQDVSAEEREEFFSLIKTNSEKLINLIDDILDLSKIEAGETSIRTAPVEVKKMLQELVFIYANDQEIKKDKPRLEVKLNIKNCHEDQMVYTDPIRIWQILTSITGNAVKFTQEGYVEVGCNVKDDHIVFHVKDTGIGIPEGQKNSIYDRFRQVDSSITREHGGAGIGLTITRSLVKLLKGKIWFESTYRKGSTFYVELPLK